jgi:hypothetical protein
MRDGIYAIRARKRAFLDIEGREFCPPRGFKGVVQNKGKWYWSKDEVAGEKK